MELAHEGVITLLHQRTFHLVSAQRIGPVQHQDLNPGLAAGAHHQAQRGDEGVAAYPDILDVVHHHVDILEHRRRRLPRAPIKGEYRQPGFGVRAALYVVAGVGIATDAVLRTIERHQIHLRRLEQNVDGGTKVPVHPAGIGHQSHPLAAEFLEAIHLQHIDAREHLRV